jgi:hypothetical protein
VIIGYSSPAGLLGSPNGESLFFPIGAYCKGGSINFTWNAGDRRSPSPMHCCQIPGFLRTIPDVRSNVPLVQCDYPVMGSSERLRG